ncbi:MAG: Na+/H+ antiporter NhaA [Cytophagaceae bacterium]|nr:Na+/H+ antiporter NhaA [Cytophagaceae bacterium]MDW8455745.1 Na+/H+ antiporter NhaA [Cytophagaceae bacterium]
MRKIRFLLAITEPVSRFIKSELSASILLFLSVVIALIWANSPWKESYEHLWEYKFEIGFHGFKLSKSLHHWINDGLMAVFFFVVGLELKREFIAGELSSFKKSILPIMAAVGGMVLPALFYMAINFSESKNLAGWGIPMATDIAFALGVLALGGKNVPVSLKIFLTALAIVDDLGAVLVIAFFYTSEISQLNLLIGFFFLCVLMIANVSGVRNTVFYAIIGISGVWVAFLMSGIHATIAGVLAAMTIPARTAVDEKSFLFKLRLLEDKFSQATPGEKSMLSSEQMHLINELNELSAKASTPLQKLEHAMHPLVLYVVMPIFALANAGIEFSTDNFFQNLFSSIPLGIMLGLFAGKFSGIVGVCKIMVWCKWATLPESTTWKHIYAVGFIAGIGFTMSLFVTKLAFTDTKLIEQAKLGIMFASLLSGVVGFVVLKFFAMSDKSKR